MIIQRKPNGMLTVCALVGDTLQSRAYHGYTTREAERAFRQEFPEKPPRLDRRQRAKSRQWARA